MFFLDLIENPGGGSCTELLKIAPFPCQIFMKVYRSTVLKLPLFIFQNYTNQNLRNITIFLSKLVNGLWQVLGPDSTFLTQITPSFPRDSGHWPWQSITFIQVVIAIQADIYFLCILSMLIVLFSIAFTLHRCWLGQSAEEHQKEKCGQFWGDLAFHQSWKAETP